MIRGGVSFITPSPKFCQQKNPSAESLQAEWLKTEYIQTTLCPPSQLTSKRSPQDKAQTYVFERITNLITLAVGISATLTTRSEDPGEISLAQWKVSVLTYVMVIQFTFLAFSGFQPAHLCILPFPPNSQIIMLSLAGWVWTEGAAQ